MTKRADERRESCELGSETDYDFTATAKVEEV